MDGWIDAGWIDNWMIGFDEQINNPQKTHMQEEKRK